MKLLLQMCPIYLTVAVISTRTQKQRDSKWNEYSCHGLRTIGIGILKKYL